MIQQSFHYLLHTLMCTSFHFLGSFFNNIPVNVGEAMFETSISHPDGDCYFILTGSKQACSIMSFFFTKNFKREFDRVLLKSSDIYQKNAKIHSSTSVSLDFPQATKYN